jgi:hypothetical protein
MKFTLVELKQRYGDVKCQRSNMIDIKEVLTAKKRMTHPTFLIMPIDHMKEAFR